MSTSGREHAVAVEPPQAIQAVTQAERDARRRLIAAMRRSAATHDRAARLFTSYGLHEKAVRHRQGAASDTARADKLSAELDATP